MTPAPIKPSISFEYLEKIDIGVGTILAEQGFGRSRRWRPLFWFAPDSTLEQVGFEPAGPPLGNPRSDARRGYSAMEGAKRRFSPQGVREANIRTVRLAHLKTMSPQCNTSLFQLSGTLIVGSFPQGWEFVT
jgi:hypothetical protein